MGGIGSGNWNKTSYRPLVGQFAALDVHDISNRGRLLKGMTFNLPVRPPAISLAVRVGATSVFGEYVGGADNPFLRNWSLHVTGTEQNFGGKRIWFRCPAPHCGERARFLHVGVNYIACRKCFGLLYPSQYEDEIRRQFTRLRKTTARLRIDAFIRPKVAKPKGMHAVTFMHLLEQQRAEQEHLRELVTCRFAPRLHRLHIPSSA